MKLNSFSSVSTVLTPNGSVNFYAAEGVDKKFRENICETLQKLSIFSPSVQNALTNLENIIILKDSASYIPENFSATKTKLNQYASDAYGFVSKPDSAIVINEQNHQRKDVLLEGNVQTQASDTLSHEIGHLIDKEYSKSQSFQQAYLQDLKDIEEKLNKNRQVKSRDLKEMLVYLKHYMEGVDFSDGIDEKDITKEGLRENFAECFSTIVDENPSEINDIFVSLFPHTMKQTLDFVI